MAQEVGTEIGILMDTHFSTTGRINSYSALKAEQSQIPPLVGPLFVISGSAEAV